MEPERGMERIVTKSFLDTNRLVLNGTIELFEFFYEFWMIEDRANDHIILENQRAILRAQVYELCVAWTLLSIVEQGQLR
mgnify:FL=1